LGLKRIGRLDKDGGPVNPDAVVSIDLKPAWSNLRQIQPGANDHRPTSGSRRIPIPGHVCQLPTEPSDLLHPWARAGGETAPAQAVRLHPSRPRHGRSPEASRSSGDLGPGCQTLAGELAPVTLVRPIYALSSRIVLYPSDAIHNEMAARAIYVLGSAGFLRRHICHQSSQMRGDSSRSTSPAAGSLQRMKPNISVIDPRAASGLVGTVAAAGWQRRKPATSEVLPVRQPRVVPTPFGGGTQRPQDMDAPPAVSGRIGGRHTLIPFQSAHRCYSSPMRHKSSTLATRSRGSTVHRPFGHRYRGNAHIRALPPSAWGPSGGRSGPGLSVCRGRCSEVLCRCRYA
jgi:hypothetical protein